MITKKWMVAGFVSATLWSMAHGVDASSFDSDLAEGIAYRQRGSIELAIDALGAARNHATTATQRAIVAAELGATLLHARRYAPAETALKNVYALQSGAAKARVAIDLGNLAIARKDTATAAAFFAEAGVLAGGDNEIAMVAGLNQARLLPIDQRLPALRALDRKIDALPEGAARVRARINLGSQAGLLGPAGVELAYRNLETASRLSTTSDRLHGEALDALAQLYEGQGRTTEARTLTAAGLAALAAIAPGAVADLRVQLEWRQGRLLRRNRQPELALAAYQRAAEQLESIRQDLPIEYEDGRSSYGVTLEPLYHGLVELLLEQSENRSGPIQAAYLRRAREVIELTRQAEMQDFLGDRCTVETVDTAATPNGLPAGTAVLYTVVLRDHTELLLETSVGIVRQRLAIPAADLQQAARRFAEQLRLGEAGYRRDAEQLYDWLLRPFDELLARRQIRNLVVVPDSTLRLVAIGALHDGRQFVIEKYAIANATGMSMTHTATGGLPGRHSLIAGLARPGPVVGKLQQLSIDQILSAGTPPIARGLADTVPTLRSLGGQRRRQAAATATDLRLMQALALPGVEDEVRAVSATLHGTSLLDEAFTVDGFNRAVEAGDYRILHIASHGMFGGNAESSFILAYDDLLTLDRLQTLLKSDKSRQVPIELLTLSACQTAEGNERAPLGIAGAAIKARARSVLGTLWPVEDNAARALMEQFYVGIGERGLGKSEALRQAQIALSRSGEFAHPFFWAPFILIGNWQ